MKPKNTAQQAPPIQMDWNPGFIRRQKKGVPFIVALIELLKNPRDWSAKMIQLFTDIPSYMGIFDDGIGMDGKNRPAFCSYNKTTAQEITQSGQFCTGKTSMLLDYCNSVEVLTVPHDEPGRVYSFNLDSETFEARMLNRQTQSLVWMPKNKQTWPFPGETGTFLKWNFTDPKSRRILRGNALANALSNRLPSMFEGIIQVDGKPLPPKQIVGDMFIDSQSHEKMGRLNVEIYQPDRKKHERGNPYEGLFLTGHEIGEVPFKDFLESIGNLADEVPEVYGLPTIAGVISALFLKPYIREDRRTFSSELMSAEGLRHLLYYLKRHAAAVEDKCGLSIKSSAIPDADEKVVENFVDRCNEVYNPKKLQPDDVGPRDVDDKIINMPDEDDDDPNNHGKPIFLRLEHSREFEPGESIDVRLKVRPHIGAIDPKTVQWLIDASLATHVEHDHESIKLKAGKKLGHGEVRVVIKGTPLSAKISYEIMAERVFAISVGITKVEVGKVVPIMGRNIDKLKESPVLWEHSGAGRLEPHGNTANFLATSIGSATVTASDPGNPKTRVTAEIQVIPRPRPLLCIDGLFFEYKLKTAEAFAHDRKVVTIEGRREGRIHRIFINTQAAAFKTAQKNGSLQPLLIQWVADAFAKFVSLFMAPDDILEQGISTVRDMRPIMDEIEVAALRVFQDLSEGSKS